jgi:hypothetical protein
MADSTRWRTCAAAGRQEQHSLSCRAQRVASAERTRGTEGGRKCKTAKGLAPFLHDSLSLTHTCANKTNAEIPDGV